MKKIINLTWTEFQELGKLISLAQRIWDEAYGKLHIGSHPESSTIQMEPDGITICLEDGLEPIE